jgi:HEAT repeat protein
VSHAADRRSVAIAGHVGDVATARAGLSHPDETVRATALGALERLGALTPDELVVHLVARTEASAVVRRRAAEVAAHFPQVALLDTLDDPDWSVVEMACWAVGEHEVADDATLERLISLAGHHEEALVREAAVAALGAVGDPRGLPAIVAATNDKPAVRRRAAVALAPFDEPDADAALRELLADRDWQTRQIAEDLLDERPPAGTS